MIITRPLSNSNIASAVCQFSDDVGDFVYFSGPKSGPDYTVTKVDPQVKTKMPAVAVIIAKPAPGRAVIQFSGETTVFTGLSPGLKYFVDDNANLSTSPPTPASPSEKRYCQIVGVASDSGILRLYFDQTIHVRKGP